jgi:hypothetical protein
VTTWPGTAYDADWHLQPNTVTFEKTSLDLDVPDMVTILRVRPIVVQAR